MRLSKLLPLTAALASALVLPDEQTMNQIAIEDNREQGFFSELKNSLQDTVDDARNTIDAAIDDASNAISEAVEEVYEYTEEKAFDFDNWMRDFNRAHEDDFDFSTQKEAAEDTMHDLWHTVKDTTNEWREDMGFESFKKGPKHQKGPPRRGGPDKFRRPYGDDPRSPFPPGPPGPPRHGEDHPPPPPHGDHPPPPPHGEHPPPPPHGEHPPPPPHGDHPPPPPHGKPPHGKPPHGKPPHHKKPHHGPPHHHKANLTVYELISKSNYTTKLTKLINEFPDVVEMLNGTKSNFTIFAPIDKAFEKIPKHGKHPPKEFLLKLLQYHVVPDLFPASRVLKSRTLPTVLEGTGLSAHPKKTTQRLSVNLSLKGLTVNFYSRVVAINIEGTNGIIHGIDSILVPPPKAAKIIQFLPGEFSTLELGLFKTGLFSALNDTSNHLGGTLFAPSNGAFQKLGPRATGFLFSKYGRKYLKALLEYHISPNTTLYSDALYVAEKTKDDPSAERTFHIDLPTLLGDKYLSIDVARFARFIDIRINGFNHVAITDGIAKDGVIHVMGNVIIPPKSPGADSEIVESEMDVHELVSRLEPFVKEDDESEDVDYEFAEEEQKPFVDMEIPLEL